MNKNNFEITRALLRSVSLLGMSKVAPKRNSSIGVYRIKAKYTEESIDKRLYYIVSQDFVNSDM